jgi:hypothetical protein
MLGAGALVTAALSLPALSLTLVPATTALAAATPPAAAAGKPVIAAFTPSRSDQCRAVSGSSTIRERCVHVQKGKLGSLTPAERALRQQAIARKVPVAKRPGAITMAPQVSTAPTQCNFGGTVVSYPDRLTSCTDVPWMVTTYQKNIYGQYVETGQYNFENLQWTTDYPGLGAWDHGMTTIGYGGWGALANGITVVLSSACDLYLTHCAASSSITPDPQTVFFPSNQTSFSFDWSELDAGPSARQSGQEEILDPYLGAEFGGDVPGYSPWSYSDIGDGLATRCDTIITATDSCVDEQFTPTLSLSINTYGAAADMIQWAQFNLSGAWGLQGSGGSGTPLKRLYNTTQRDTNRKIICDSTFINQGTAIGGDDGSSDSCDEFPFAATYQSGAMNGVTSGSQCAQVTAVENAQRTGNLATDWRTVQPTGTYSNQAKCVRGHIPLSLNTNVGTAYSNFISPNRLLDLDPFWVSVVP